MFDVKNGHPVDADNGYCRKQSPNPQKITTRDARERKAVCWNARERTLGARAQMKCQKICRANERKNDHH